MRCFCIRRYYTSLFYFIFISTIIHFHTGKEDPTVVGMLGTECLRHTKVCQVMFKSVIMLVWRIYL